MARDHEAINARSRKPAHCRCPMLSSSAALLSDRALGFAPTWPTCQGLRTECAGLTGTIQPLTTQSNRCRSATRRCLPRALRARASTPLDPCRDIHRLDGGDRRHAGLQRIAERGTPFGLPRPVQGPGQGGCEKSPLVPSIGLLKAAGFAQRVGVTKPSFVPIAARNPA